MMSLAIHECRMLGRRAVWPAALVVHAAAASMFVAIWGPSGGVSLWEATVLQQLSAVDRLATAVLLTWLSTFVCSDDEGGARSVLDWSALAARSPQTVFRARIAAIAVLGLIFMSTALPAFVAAGEVSAAPMREVAGQIAAAFGFACLCLGVTSVASVLVHDRVAVWCSAMALCLLAAVGVRLLDTTLLRAAVPAIMGVVLLALAPAGVGDRGRLNGD